MQHECPRSTLDRRRLITLAGAAFFASSLARATGPGAQAQPPSGPESQLARLVRWASEAGVPLLLMVEGTSAEYRWLQWKQVFERASADTLAELALCEFEFVTASDVFGVWPDADLNPVMIPLGLLIEPGSAKFKEIRITTDLPEAEAFRDPSRARELEPWLREVHGKLHNVIAPDATTLDRRMRVMLGLAPAPSPFDPRPLPGAAIALAEDRRSQLVTRGRRLRTYLFRGPDPRGVGPNGLSSGSSGPCGSSIVSRRSARFLGCYVERGRAVAPRCSVEPRRVDLTRSN